MKKINLKICMGTMCYVMGGAELKNVADMLTPEEREHINVKFASCLGYCCKRNDPPYVELNGRMIAGVSKSNLIQIIKEEIKNVI
ncbi:NAD(P)H-dependent oxidoreductase subunit E [Porphyromonadaceae bacterium OttesenSCG-928-L07]|nr:NAD(P)H-dependent oxidoreductase subunit E [Porphyromonadaceae bacterium OttesenSCG-928-L07]MDL2330798.1 NAD(P)H-dependent oxidoreductase subunit E [Odoribacter sp. OttesenSCG-928-A06]